MQSPLDLTNPQDPADIPREPDKIRGSDEPLHILRASNELLFADDRRSYVDLLCGFGTVFLGHCNPAINLPVAEQLRKVWATGRLPTSAMLEAKTLTETFFPPTHHLASLYSTGMEAAEFALRVARVATGRPGVVGFERSTHGKSLATAYLGWHNELVNLPEFQRLPFVSSEPEGEILRLLATRLSSRSVSAVFVEPLHGSGEGHMASTAFYREVADLCARYGSLCVFDEILTGFYRTGDGFRFEALGFVPDIILIGKAMGNGFPVSGVVLNKKISMETRMLPGSTFSGNPLAASVVLATLSQMRSMDMPALVAQVEKVITEELHALTRIGITLRGKGALWVLQFPPRMNVSRLVGGLRDRGVVVGSAGSCIRLLPPATISAEHLSASCAAIRETCLEENSRCHA